MQPDQYHLCKIAEEAAEVAQRAMKAQQFGFDEIQPGETENNLERLISEFHDLLTTVDNMLGNIETDLVIMPSQEVYLARIEKMARFLNLSIELGQVDDHTTI